MSRARRTIRLVAEREARDRATNRVFLLTTLLMLVGMAALVVLPVLLADDAGLELGLVGEAPEGFVATVETLARAQDREVAVTQLADRPSATAAIGAGDLDVVYIVDDDELLADGHPPDVLRSLVDAGRQQAAVAGALADAGFTAADLAAVLDPPPPVRVVGLDGTATEGDEFGIEYLVASLSGGLLFVVVMLNTTSLLTVALEEKSSRVIEVLASAVRPWELLTGKILAMTALALGQFALLVGTGLFANAAVGGAELPQVGTPMIAVTLLMLVVGFLFFASLYTVAGSMATSSEDAQSTAGPLNFLLVGTWFAVIFAVLPAPDGVWAGVLTFVPPTAPFVVPARMAFDAIPVWQVAASAGLTALAAVLVVRVAGRLYASVLLAGGKLTWRDAWRAEPIR